MILVVLVYSLCSVIITIEKYASCEAIDEMATYSFKSFSRTGHGIGTSYDYAYSGAINSGACALFATAIHSSECNTKINLVGLQTWSCRPVN